MLNFPPSSKKIIVLSLLIALIANFSLPIFFQKKAEAQLGPITAIVKEVIKVIEKYPYMAGFAGLIGVLAVLCPVTVTPFGVGVEVQGACGPIREALNWLEKHAKDFYNSFLKKKLLEYLTDSIIRWIQGEEGKPLFVTNWRKFLSDVAGEAAGEYIKTTKLAFLCQSFDFQIRASLPQPGRPPLPTCTLNRIVANIEDFYGDFRHGGWVAYNEMLYPWNNPYGAYLMALEGQAYEVAAALAEKEKEAQQAQGGFLAIKRCKMEFINPLTGEFECLEYETVTPGNVVAEQVTKALGSSLDFIVNSDDLTVYLTAIADAAINRLMKETLSGGGLSTMSTSKAPAYGDLGTAPSSDYWTIKYSCVSGTCQQNENGEYESLGACTANCQLRFSCFGGTCFLDLEGEYSSLNECQESCVPLCNISNCYTCPDAFSCYNAGCFWNDAIQRCVLTPSP